MKLEDVWFEFLKVNDGGLLTFDDDDIGQLLLMDHSRLTVQHVIKFTVRDVHSSRLTPEYHSWQKPLYKTSSN